MGTQVIVPYRDEDEVRRLKLMGDLGKVVKMVNLLLLERDVLVAQRIVLDAYYRSGTSEMRTRSLNVSGTPTSCTILWGGISKPSP